MVFDLTRRSFTAGLSGVVSRAIAGPIGGGRQAVGQVIDGTEIEDAYERLLSEYVRIEEAAIAAGSRSGAGASTFVGRQLEDFIGDLDAGVDLGTRAGEVYSAFRQRLRDAVKRLAERQDNATEVAGGADLTGQANAALDDDDREALGAGLEREGVVCLTSEAQAAQGVEAVHAPGRTARCDETCNADRGEADGQSARNQCGGNARLR